MKIRTNDLSAIPKHEDVEKSHELKTLDEAAYKLPEPVSRAERWSEVELGLVQKLFKFVFINISEKAAGILTILTSVALSIADIVSDIVIAISLFTKQNHLLGLVVFFVDVLPSLAVATHNIISEKWKSVTLSKDRLATLWLVLLSPFSGPLFHLRWLCHFESADEVIFDYLHHNARLSSLLSGSFESPLQLILLLIFWGNGTMEHPWSNITCTVDSQGRKLCLGIFPGIFSLSISTLSILKGSLDIAEGHTWKEKLVVFIYAFSNYLFRIPTFALIVLYFNEWSAIIFLSIFLINCIFIVRFDQAKRQDFSIVSSVLIASISPFMASDQANLYQRINRDRNYEVDDSENKNRRQLSAKISIATLPILLISNLVLYLLLAYHDEFITPTLKSNLILEKESVEKVLVIFLLPLGGFLMLSSLIYYHVIMPAQNPSRNYYGASYIYTQIYEEFKLKFKFCAQGMVTFLVFIGIITLFGLTVHYVASGEKGK